MKDLKDIIQESLADNVNEALQVKVAKAVADMQKNHKNEIAYVVIIPFNDEELEKEFDGNFGPVATDCGKLYGIKNK